VRPGHEGEHLRPDVAGPGPGEQRLQDKVPGDHVQAQCQRHGKACLAGAPERQQHCRECNPELAVGTGGIEEHSQRIQHRAAQGLQGIQNGKFKGHRVCLPSCLFVFMVAQRVVQNKDETCTKKKEMLN